MKIFDYHDIKPIIARVDKKSIFILPSDTIYGLSGAIYNDSIRMKINHLKQRDPNQNMIILVSKIKQIKKIIQWDPKYKMYLNLDSPTTIIGWKNPNLQINNLCTNKKIAVRLIKHHRLIKKIISKIGPIFSTSANLHNEEYQNSLSSFKKLNPDFIIYSKDYNDNNSPSNIYDLTTKRFLRKKV